MLKTEKNGRYADVMERALYNGIISGMQLDGKRFFYVNPLEVNPGVSGEIFGYKHVIPERPGWYACACCPPNLVRMVTSLGKYAWDEDETAVYSHLFLGQEAALGKADIRVESAYPWEGSMTYHVSAKIDELFTLAIHIPAYVKDLRVTVNGEAFDTAGEIRDGYLYISRKWGSDDQVELHFPLPVRKIYASTHVREDVGCVALMRGPVVYCFEGADNGANLQALAVKKELDAKALVCTEGKAFRSHTARCGGDPACAVGGTLYRGTAEGRSGYASRNPLFCMGQSWFKPDARLDAREIKSKNGAAA